MKTLNLPWQWLSLQARVLGAISLLLATLTSGGQGLINVNVQIPPEPGVFWGINITARTRIGSIDGEFAGSAIRAQFLAGPTIDSLKPVGMSLVHDDGYVSGPNIVLADLLCGSVAQVQMVAWDGSVWGTAYEAVPPSQLGRTDIVPVTLSCAPFPINGPGFTQSAIVPPVPEPSTWVLLVLGGLSVCRKTRSLRR